MTSEVLHNGLFYADMSEIGRLQRNLREYVRVRSKLTEDEILTKKGNDLRIKLFEGFWAHRFLKKKRARLNWGAALRLILAGHEGIKVRLNSLIEPWSSRVPSVDKNGRPLSLRQKLVAQEIMRRISGSGVLGVSFLGKRWRFNKKGSFLVVNRTNSLGTAAKFEKRQGEYIITGFTPGLLKIVQRYGIIREALSRVSQDIEKYLSDKVGHAFVEALHAR